MIALIVVVLAVLTIGGGYLAWLAIDAREHPPRPTPRRVLAELLRTDQLLAEAAALLAGPGQHHRPARHRA